MRVRHRHQACRTAADPLIVHPDVRRMLLTGKAYNEGARAFSYWLAMQLDIEEHATDEAQRQDAADLVALLTPIAKAFMTDNGWRHQSVATGVRRPRLHPRNRHGAVRAKRCTDFDDLRRHQRHSRRWT